MQGSREKTKIVIEALIDEKLPPAFAAFAAAQITLPNSDQELDQQLADYASMCLQLRSDDATVLEVTERAASVEFEPAGEV